MESLREEHRVLDVGEIALYDHNPRHTANPKFDVIKASIRAHGMDQPLVVTQRPGEVAYRVYAGGNTRLSILKALYEETGDARFSRVPCVVRAWHWMDAAHFEEVPWHSGGGRSVSPPI